MRQELITWIAACAVLLLAACAGAPPTATDHAATVAALAEDAWQHLLEQNPYLQNRQGMRVTELPDLSEEDAAREVEWARSMLARIEALPVDELSHEDALTVECLRWDYQIAVDGEPWYWHQFPITPYQAGFMASAAQLMLGSYTFAEADEKEKYVGLVGELADFFDQLAAHTRGQTERGIYLSRHALPGTVGLFQALAGGVMRNAIAVSEEKLAALPEDERETFAAAVTEAVSTRLEPAIGRVVEILTSEDYQANAPDAVGLAHYPDGEDYYRYLVRAHTTMNKTPEELHELGKKRVAELEAEMAAIRDELGFAGSREEFHEMLRTDPRFLAETPADVEARYMGYIERIEPLVGDYFATQPKAPYGVKRLDEAQEASMTFGFYQQPSPTDPVGNYRYNGSKLSERSLIWAGPLIYHELVPGHHFHIASQNENESLPMYRRENIAYGAFTEGWGNYGAKLAAEMGLLDDPYDRYGWALFDMFISVRLVVDTGMNLMGWSLEEGRQYMRDHMFQSETEILTESLRYSTDMPGQALNYKGGLEKLLELRARAAELAGPDFDVKDFHDAALGSGALPMEVLAQHVEWKFDPVRRGAPKG